MVFVTILLSHLIAALPFYLYVRKGKMPNTSDFAAISCILYYDLGLAIETLGFGNDDDYFTPFFEAKEDVLVKGIVILLVAPWLFHLGSIIAKNGKNVNVKDTIATLSSSRRTIFYLFTTIISLTLLISGNKQLHLNDSIWAGRAEIGDVLGPLIIILYLPIHFLAFYVKTSDANTKYGLLFSLFLLVASILSTLVVGQRTTVLLPILIVVFFRKKLSLNKIFIFASIAIIGAAAFLPIFKWQYADRGYSIGELLVETVNGDLYRGNVLATALEMTEPLGTKVMPYPMSGYIYSLLYYVPRQLVPFKGWSTAQYFTSDIVRTPVEDTDWGFGIGAIEEILLNIGFWLCIPGFLSYGICMGLLDRLSWSVPSLVIPTRLAAIWLCGYNLVTLLLLFGTMAIVGWVFHHLFMQKVSYVSQMPEPSSVPFHKKPITRMKKFF
jgi:hypothetical protein